MDVVRELIDRVQAKGVATDQSLNPFWKGQLARVIETFEGGKTPTVEQVQVALGYLSEPLPEGVKTNKQMPGWQQLMAEVKANHSGSTDKLHREHVGALMTLARNKLISPYLTLIDAIKVKSSFNEARYFWHLHKTKMALETVEKSGRLNVLEVGAGAGQYALHLIRGGLVDNYVIVDLPEMLVNSAANIIAAIGADAVRFGEAPDMAPTPTPRVWLLDTGDIRRVPPNSVDLASNFNSFAEMDEDIRDGYIAQIYRTARSGCIFYNVNRRQMNMTRRDGSSHETNPLLYPYHRTDRVLEWEPDRLQQDNRSVEFFSSHKNFSISSIREIA